MNDLIKKATMLLIALVVGLCMTCLSNTDSSFAAVKKIHLKQTAVTVVVPGSYQQKLIDKRGKTIKATNVKWTSKKTSVAKISKKGKVTAIKAGTAKMTAKYKGKTYKFTVTVNLPFNEGDAPQNIIAKKYPSYSAGKYHIVLEWDKLKNARDYNIYVSKNDEGYKLYCNSDELEADYVYEIDATQDICYSFKIRGIRGKYKSDFSEPLNVMVLHDFLSVDQEIYNIDIGETTTINVSCNEERGLGYAGGQGYINILGRNDYKENGASHYSYSVKGIKPGKSTLSFYTYDTNTYDHPITIQVVINVSTPDSARAYLRDYVLTHGKEVTSSSGVIGDYYIESRASATATANRIVISAYVNRDTIVMYSIAKDGSEFNLFHNQADVQQGIDNFMYYTNQKEPGNLFPTDYWGNVIMNTYSGGLYGSEDGLTDIEKTGPSAVTDETELYKVYRRASDSMKEFDTFVNSKAGFGIRFLGYSNLNGDFR